MCDYLAETRLRAIIQQGFAAACDHGLNSDKAPILMVGLSCFMGHGFAKDPLCGWIGARLDTTRFSNSTQRTDELYKKSLLYLQHVLAQDVKDKL